MEFALTSIGTFIIIYLLYYIFIVRVQRKKRYRKLSPDASIFKDYYKIDIKKVGYKRFYRILNFVNTLMLTLLIMVVYIVDSTIIKIILLAILMLPSIWCVYYFLAKFYYYLERKGE